MAEKISKAKAEQVRKAIVRRYKGCFGTGIGQWREEPSLVKNSDGSWLVVWESGPYEWSLELASELEERVKGVFLEPYYSYALGVYPE